MANGSRENYNFLFKFLIIGNPGTGKSCLLHQFIERKFDRNIIPENLLKMMYEFSIFELKTVKADTAHTIGVEFGSKVVQIAGRACKLQLWDTAGQERFRSVTKSYYRGAAGAVLVYDVTCRQSFNAVGQWLSDACSLASPHLCVILAGNKTDLASELRQVPTSEGERFAHEHDLLFIETSALTGHNVEEAFLRCARKILGKLDTGEIDAQSLGYGIQLGDVILTNRRAEQRNHMIRCSLPNCS